MKINCKKAVSTAKDETKVKKSTGIVNKKSKTSKKQVNDYEVRRYVTLEVEFIEKVPKADYTGTKLDPKDQKEWEKNLKELLKADSVNIKNVKDFLGEQ